jgi:hypothetical protein
MASILRILMCVVVGYRKVAECHDFKELDGKMTVKRNPTNLNQQGSFAGESPKQFTIKLLLSPTLRLGLTSDGSANSWLVASFVQSRCLNS